MWEIVISLRVGQATTMGRHHNRVVMTSVSMKSNSSANFKAREKHSLAVKPKNVRTVAKSSHCNYIFGLMFPWLLLISLSYTHALPSNDQETEFVEAGQPLEFLIVQRRSSEGTSSSMDSTRGDKLEKMIFTGRIAAQDGDEDDTEKEHLVFEDEENEDEPSLLVNIGTEDDGRRPVVVVDEPRKEKTKTTINQRQNRKRYLVSRSALRQKLLDRNKAEAEKPSSADQDPFMLVDSSFSSPFDSRPSLNSLAAGNKAVAAAARALLSSYHASLKKDDPVRLCGIKLSNRTREICQHCPPAHLRPLFLIEKRGTIHRTAGTRNVEKLTELCCVRKCTDETIRRLCCKEDHT